MMRSPLPCAFLAVSPVLALLALSPTKANAEPATPDRPNVLFILTEDQGPHLSFRGTPGLRTPHMDRIARRGVYFENFSVTYPVCSASKAALYTGAYGHATGLVENTNNFFVPADQLTPGQRNSPVYQRIRLADRFRTLTEILHDAGYYSAVSGKLHVAPNEKFPYDLWRRPNTRDTALELVGNARAAGKPWFFFCNIQAPHRPYRNADETTIGVDPDDVELPGFLPNTPITRLDWAEYLDYVEVADQRLGAVMAALGQVGGLQNTIIVFMGDHGPPYHRGKMSLYQFGLNVPFAIAGPGVTGGRTTDALMCNVDVLPTLLDLLGLPKPDTIQGQSLVGVVRGESDAPTREFTFAAISHEGQSTDDGMQERSAFDGRWKLIFRNATDKPRTVNSDLKYWLLEVPDGRKFPWRNRVYREIVEKREQFPREFALLQQIDPQSFDGVKLPRFELYDTQTDPWEMTNLAGQPEHAEVQVRLTQALREWIDTTDDRFLDPAEITSD